MPLPKHAKQGLGLLTLDGDTRPDRPACPTSRLPNTDPRSVVCISGRKFDLDKIPIPLNF